MLSIPYPRNAKAVLAALGALCGCTAPDASGLYGVGSPRGAAESTESARGVGAAPREESVQRPLEPSSGAPPATGDVAAEEAMSLSRASPEASAPAQPLPPPPAPASDAGADAPDAATASPAPECAGAALQDVCWYLGDDRQSCEAVCSAHGGVSVAALAVIGTPTQGGSLEGCAAVLRALDTALAVREGVRMDGLGLGCHVFIDAGGAVSDAWWLTSPDLTSTASGIQVRRACGCLR